nr:hypothetical protein Iba_chr14dCG15110 [Ipomoea batatas]
MRTSSVLPKREASRKHWLTLSAPPSTNIPSNPCIAVADIPDAQPGSDELENRVRGKQAASKASVKSFPVRLFPARSRKVLKADSCSLSSFPGSESEVFVLNLSFLAPQLQAPPAPVDALKSFPASGASLEKTTLRLLPSPFSELKTTI